MAWFRNSSFVLYKCIVGTEKLKTKNVAKSLQGFN